MAYFLNCPACNGAHSAHLCGKGYNDSWKYTAVQKEQDRSTPLPQSFPAEISKPSPNPYLIYAAEMRETVILQNNLVESNDPMEVSDGLFRRACVHLLQAATEESDGKRA